MKKLQCRSVCVIRASESTSKYTMWFNTFFSLFDCAFFHDQAQRNPGRLDKDGRSCAVRQTHDPFVSTTMQVQEGGDVTVKKEDK